MSDRSDWVKKVLTYDPASERLFINDEPCGTEVTDKVLRCLSGEHEKEEDLEIRHSVRSSMRDDRFKVCRHCKAVFWYG